MVDFGELWRRESRDRRAPDTAAAWDARARDEVSKYTPSAYSEAFLQKANLLPGESVFDMGCGAGALAIPCAQRGHQVLAADFSPMMLERCAAGIPADAPGSVTVKLLDWDEDWRSAGIAPDSYDVAFASRSLATADMEAAIAKLSSVARRRVCVTLVAGSSPRVSDALFADLGLSCTGHQDAAFAYAIASSLGFKPEAGFIHSTRIDRFSSRADAEEAYLGMLRFADEIPEGHDVEQLRTRVRAWVGEHLVDACTLDAGDDACPAVKEIERPLPYAIDIPRAFSWAFISWDVRGAV